MILSYFRFFAMGVKTKLKIRKRIICNNLNLNPKEIIYYTKCGDDACLAKEIEHNREAYVFLNAARPRVGKLSKPQESPTPLKNHLKQLQKKLMLRYFPRLRTCFLQ